MDIPPIQTLVDQAARDGYFAPRAAELRAEVSRLESHLAGREPPRNFYLSGISEHAQPAALPDDLRARFEALTPRVWGATVPNKGSLEVGLLKHLAFTASPTSLPVFLAAIEFTRPRDQLGSVRRPWAVAGVAFLAHRRKDAAAQKAFDALIAHPNAHVGASTADAVATLERTEERRLTSAGVTRLQTIAVTGATFESRFLARAALLSDDRELPLEESDEVYQVTVTFGGASRTVELLASATLTDLCALVVSALGWDHDHFWALYLSERFAHPVLRVQPDGDPWAGEDLMSGLTLDEVGFPAGHRLQMLYDFGDHNVFRLRVDGRAPRNPRAKYPRIAAQKGPSPKQYRSR